MSHANEQDNEFKHITLTPAEAEDEVIIAGVTAEDVPSDALDEEVVACATLEEPNPKKTDEERIAQEMKDESSSARSKDKLASDGAPARSKDDYHETTLEDLRSVKMPVSQKIVLIAAIVLIIVAITYYFMVLR